jgi:hypothetical protein
MEWKGMLSHLKLSACEDAVMESSPYETRQDVLVHAKVNLSTLCISSCIRFAGFPSPSPPWRQAIQDDGILFTDNKKESTSLPFPFLSLNIVISVEYAAMQTKPLAGALISLVNKFENKFETDKELYRLHSRQGMKSPCTIYVGRENMRLFSSFFFHPNYSN